MADDCIFCKIAKGEIPSTKLYEDEQVLSFLDIMPAAKGHALVIPKKHYHTLLDIPHEELREIMAVVQKVAAAIMATTDATGFNVIQSNQKVAGQVIAHLHFHIIPRKEGDRLHFEWEQGKAEKEELQRYAELVRKKIK
ncbi:MAG: HIT family protein [Candidatus Diapherotrites archaeon]|nr:HIT family protein [Candidatus Diapherotrites archaeon]